MNIQDKVNGGKLLRDRSGEVKILISLIISCTAAGMGSAANGYEIVQVNKGSYTYVISSSISNNSIFIKKRDLV